MLNNVKISSRLIVMLVSMLVLAVVLGGMGLFGMNKANEGMRSVYEDRTIPGGQIAEIQKLLLTNRLRVTASLENPTAEELQKNTAEVEQNIAEIGRVWEAYMAGHLTPKTGRASWRTGLNPPWRHCAPMTSNWPTRSWWKKYVPFTSRSGRASGR